MGIDPDAKDRRLSKRLRGPIPCAVHRGAAAEVPAERAMIDNVGSEGLGLSGGGPLAAGEQLSLSFTLAGTHFEELPGAVVWSRETQAGWRAGVRFPEAWSARLQRALLQPVRQSVLIVESDPRVVAALEQTLAGAGYLPTAADGADSAARLFEKQPFDLVVAALSLPGGGGAQVVERIQTHPRGPVTPILLLTAAASQETRLASALGADHCLAKPVDPADFLFAVSALLRRMSYDGAIRFERGEIDPDTRAVRIEGREVAGLRPKEFDLLYRLIAERPKALTRRYLLSRVWNTALPEDTVDARVESLRGKLGSKAAARIVTVTGKGFKFR